MEDFGCSYQQLSSLLFSSGQTGVKLSGTVATDRAKCAGWLLKSLSGICKPQESNPVCLF